MSLRDGAELSASLMYCTTADARAPPLALDKMAVDPTQPEAVYDT